MFSSIHTAYNTHKLQADAVRQAAISEQREQALTLQAEGTPIEEVDASQVQDTDVDADRARKDRRNFLSEFPWLSLIWKIANLYCDGPTQSRATQTTQRSYRGCCSDSSEGGCYGWR